MKIEFLRNKQKEEVRDLIQGFSFRYVTDLNDFAKSSKQYGFISPETAEHLHQLLRKWQACRPSSVNKDLLPLLMELDADLTTIATIDLRNIRHASSKQREAIARIWSTLINQICENRQLAEVATSKTILILTNGRLGPALDSKVRDTLSISRIQNSDDYFDFLLAISEDIAIFEEKSSPIHLEDLISEECHPVAVGRAYDMAAGPRDNNNEKKPNPKQQRNYQASAPFSFDDAFQLLQQKGPAHVISSRGTKYTVEARIMRNGNTAIRAQPGSGYIYIHADCWGKDITCQGTRAGGIYNGENSIYIWLKDQKMFFPQKNS